METSQYLANLCDDLQAERDRLSDLLAYFLPYAPEPLPSMAGGEYADNYAAAQALAKSEKP